MSTKRQPSKQRRQTQNQRERAARQARTANAAAEAAPTGKVGGTTLPAKSGSVLSRLTGTSGTSGKSGSTAAARGRSSSTDLPVGHRAALTAVILAATSILFVIFTIRVPLGASGDPIRTSTDRVAEWAGAALDAASSLDEPTGAEVADAVDDWSPSGRERYITALFPQSLAVFLPLIAAALGFQAVRQRRPAKIVNRAMYATLFGALLTVDLLIFFLPTVVSMAVASFQVRKYEFAMKAAEAGPPEDEVIDVDEVDDDAEEPAP